MGVSVRLFCVSVTLCVGCFGAKRHHQFSPLATNFFVQPGGDLPQFQQYRTVVTTLLWRKAPLPIFTYYSNSGHHFLLPQRAVHQILVSPTATNCCAAKLRHPVFISIFPKRCHPFILPPELGHLNSYNYPKPLLPICYASTVYHPNSILSLRG
jgi:hypothetical protein